MATTRRRGARKGAGAQSALRTDGRHCPVCLQQLARMAATGASARSCGHCGAQRQPDKQCAQCLRESVWEAGSKAACQGCGHHGSRVKVVVGALEEEPESGE